MLMLWFNRIQQARPAEHAQIDARIKLHQLHCTGTQSTVRLPPCTQNTHSILLTYAFRQDHVREGGAGSA